MSATVLTFESYNLQTTTDADATILTKDINYRHLPTKEINIKSDTIRDGFDVLDVRYAEKIITISGWLKATDSAHLRTLIDNFKKNLKSKEGTLVIGYGDSTLTYTATVRSMPPLEEHWMTTQIPFEVEFLCEPFGKASSSSSSAWSTQSSSLSGTTMATAGTYKSLPTITLAVTTADSLTKVKLETGSDWIEVEPDGGFGNGDSLVINCEDETVELNNSSEDFDGVFPRFSNGTPTFNFTVTGAGGSLDYTLTISYWPRYL